MNKRLTWIWMAVCLPLFALGQGTGDAASLPSFSLSGLLLDEENSASVPFANLVNLRSLEGTASDKSGFFSLKVQAGDSIRISSIGYQPYLLRVAEDLSVSQSVQVLMTPQMVTLDPARVNAQYDVYQLSGMLINAISNVPVPYANIIDLNTATGTVSDPKGFFSFVVAPGDSIRISSVGYKTQRLRVPDSLPGYLQSIAVYLLPDTIELAPATVYPWPDRNSFRDAFMAIQLETPEEEISEHAGFRKVENPVEPKASPMNPASFIYDKIVKPIKKNKRKRKKAKELPKMGGDN